MHELRNQHVSIGWFPVRSKPLLCFVQGQDQKTEQKHTTKNFDEFHNHSPVLTMPHPKIYTIPTAPAFQIFTTLYETIPLFVQGISISLFMVSNQLATRLRNYSQRIKIPKK